ncbi:hypothetical protein I6G82_08450 [Lysinibacillus macroides]|uniref:hypothetical protein n=1 Tax=Lysinibacillus macroides TaxID=33935 RepID=UPI000A72CD4E|nr:hypothetical protein [Lysinibacillus macroides]QPR69600.1 hypothetical protein I6G82_08450 [Lysinibacillus macroides]
MQEVKLGNTFVIRTDDENFKQAIDQFLASHCDENKVNAACYDLNEVGAKKVMDIVFEE